MTLLARRVRSTPHRSCAETWERIVALLAPTLGGARDELLRVGGIASSIIATEVPKDSPIVVWGAGPRVRVYCLYGEESVLGDDANELALAESPTSGDWSLSLPCEEEDLVWVRASLAKLSARVSVRKPTDDVELEGDDSTGKRESPVTIERKAFLRP